MLGNLCRCTGYRPILQSFQNCPLNGSASDIEDIGRVHEESIEASRNIMYTHGKSEISRIENAIVLKKYKCTTHNIEENYCYF
jgi:xanthine dehydrogenase iron-sulfur cluster and FAD-binding subunit A